MRRIERWFASNGWRPFEFQRRAWEAYRAGRSGLVHAPTGTGKTQAVWLGPVAEYLAEHPELAKPKAKKRADHEPLRVLWITPLRALANDTAKSMREPVEAMGLPWLIECRTGDTAASLKQAQRKHLPTALVTTPESLSLLLSYEDSREMFANLRAVVVDEWHELMGTKRGVQTELCLARLRAWRPELRTWGLSATLGNTEQAMDVLLGATASGGVLIQGREPKKTEVATLLPESVERFPWAGHLGTKMLQQAIDTIDGANSTLLFTNTRSQAEIWFQSLLRARPEWIGAIALHHGSLDREVREEVEDLLRAGRLKCVVCTSSLDLGVDFTPVDRVIQVGSPKGVARLMQRAGRSGHQPGATSRIYGVPTNAMELVEFAAARDAAERKEIESREPLDRPIDVLVQHLVTVGLGGGFTAAEMLAEVRTAHAYRRLTQQEWQWALDFVTRGGPALKAYPHFARVVERGGRYTVENRTIAQMHRMSIGTITADTAMKVQYVGGRVLGTIEESFIARLKCGDKFTFAGRILELARVYQMTAYVKKASGRGTVPQWNGGKSPLSTELAAAVRRKVEDALRGRYDEPELQAARPVLELQRQTSRLPAADELLIEMLHDRDGYHAILYGFQGRLVHEGIGALLAYRVAQLEPHSLTTTHNDYGIELLSRSPLPGTEAEWRKILTTDRLLEDLLSCLNATQLARRRFRDIARVAGLVFQGYPGMPKAARHLQASSELFFDVFEQFDPQNLLLDQARREVLERELEARRMRQALERLAEQKIVIVRPQRLTPMAFPIWADRLREAHVSSEKWLDRVKRMAVTLEEQAEKDDARKSTARKPKRQREVGRADAAPAA